MYRGFKYFKKGIFLSTLLFLCTAYAYGQSEALDKAKDATAVEKNKKETDSKVSTTAKETIDVINDKASATENKRVDKKSNDADGKKTNTDSTSVTNTSEAVKKIPGKSVGPKEGKGHTVKRSTSAVSRNKRKKTAVKGPVKESKTETAATKLNSNTTAVSSLMHVSSKEYRYDRIPGIILKKREVVAEESIVKIEEEKSSNVDTSEKGNGGLFGFSPTTIKVSIVILIFIVFVLYKLRSKHSRSGVVKSYRRN